MTVFVTPRSVFSEEHPCTHRHCRRNPVWCGRCSSLIGCKEVPRVFADRDRCAECVMFWHLGRGLAKCWPYRPRGGILAAIAAAPGGRR